MAALPPLLLLLASSAVAGSFDIHVGVDHAGGDIQDKPRKGADGRPVARRGQTARLHKEGVDRRRRLAAPTQQVRRRPWLRSPEL